MEAFAEPSVVDQPPAGFAHGRGGPDEVSKSGASGFRSPGGVLITMSGPSRTAQFSIRVIRYAMKWSGLATSTSNRIQQLEAIEEAMVSARERICTPVANTLLLLNDYPPAQSAPRKTEAPD